jgi:hypothetical protein
MIRLHLQETKAMWKMRITRTHKRMRSIEFSGPAVEKASCPVCGCRVSTLTENQAAEVLGVDAQAIRELIEAGRLHDIPLITGGCRICQESLFTSGTGILPN